MDKLPKTQGSFGEKIRNEQRHRIKRTCAWSMAIAAVLIVAIGTVAILNTVRDDGAGQSIQSIRIDGADVDVGNIPEYSGQPYVIINDNSPNLLSLTEDPTVAFEYYSDLDPLGRCGTAFANICQEIMPTEERGNIGDIYPSGWNNERSESIDQEYLFNRCHLIGFQLTGDNANEKNLITGTRYFNIEGMLPFENGVRKYINETQNHVLYRVTPVYEGENLVASGVVLEAWSVEDNGKGVSFDVYIYNVQPGFYIDYSTGENQRLEQ